MAVTYAASLAGVVVLQGALAGVDPADGAEFHGEVSEAPVMGSFDLTDLPDSAALAGQVTVTGSLAAADLMADTTSFSAAALVQGAMALTEGGPDTATVLCGTVVQGALSATETGDTASFETVSRILGELSGADLSDVAAFLGHLVAVIVRPVGSVPPGLSVVRRCSCPAYSSKRRQIWALATAIETAIGAARGRGANVAPRPVDAWQLARQMLDDHTLSELMNDPSATQDLLAEHWDDATLNKVN